MVVCISSSVSFAAMSCPDTWCAGAGSELGPELEREGPAVAAVDSSLLPAGAAEEEQPHEHTHHVEHHTACDQVGVSRVGVHHIPAFTQLLLPNQLRRGRPNLNLSLTPRESAQQE